MRVEPTEDMTQLFFSKFSNWKKLQKAVAWMPRYKEWMMKKVWKRDTDNDKMKNKTISVEEMQKAKHCITSCVQKENFCRRTQYVEVREIC